MSISCKCNAGTGLCDNCLMKQFIKEVSCVKESRSRRMKRATYAVLLTLPLYLIIGMKYGLMQEIIAIICVIYGQCFSEIIDWCMRKF